VPKTQAKSVPMLIAPNVWANIIKVGVTVVGEIPMPEVEQGFSAVGFDTMAEKAMKDARTAREMILKEIAERGLPAVLEDIHNHRRIIC